MVVAPRRVVRAGNDVARIEQDGADLAAAGAGAELRDTEGRAEGAEARPDLGGTGFSLQQEVVSVTTLRDPACVVPSGAPSFDDAPASWCGGQPRPIPSMGWLRWMLPVEPWKCVPAPNAKTPPSEATR